MPETGGGLWGRISWALCRMEQPPWPHLFDARSPPVLISTGVPRLHPVFPGGRSTPEKTRVISLTSPPLLGSCVHRCSSAKGAGPPGSGDPGLPPPRGGACTAIRWVVPLFHAGLGCTAKRPPPAALLNSCGCPLIHKTGPPLPAENGHKVAKLGTLGPRPPRQRQQGTEAGPGP